MWPRAISPRRIVTYASIVILLVLADPQPLSYAIGCALAALGIALRIWGCGHLRKNVELITSGPYAYVQHPLYVGTFLITVGAVVAGGSPRAPGMLIWSVFGPVFLLVFFGYYLPKKKRIEGKRLADRFGAAFEEYGRAVPATIPSFTRYRKGADRPWSWRTYRENDELEMGLVIVALFVLMLFSGGRLPLP